MALLTAHRTHSGEGRQGRGTPAQSHFSRPRALPPESWVSAPSGTNPGTLFGFASLDLKCLLTFYPVVSLENVSQLIPKGSDQWKISITARSPGPPTQGSGETILPWLANSRNCHLFVLMWAWVCPNSEKLSILLFPLKGIFLQFLF